MISSPRGMRSAWPAGRRPTWNPHTCDRRMRLYKVCLDLTPNEMHDRHGGIGRYTQYLLPELTRLLAESPCGIELSALISSARPPVPAESVDLASLLSRATIHARLHRVRRRMIAGPRLLQAGVDLFHATQVVALPIAPAVHSVVTAHDVVSLAHPRQARGAAERAITALKRARESIRYRRASHVICVSQQTRDDLLRFAGVPSRRMSVVHHGVDTRLFHSHAGAAEAPSLRQAFDLPERYFLAVGSDHYRKNHERLFDAWSRVAPYVPEGLVIVGKTLYDTTLHQLRDKVEKQGLAARFRWLPDVSDAQLPALYRRATAYVAPSLYEGFGMTILEAMASGAPVLAARNGAYEEVAQDDAVFFDPYSVQALSACLHQLSADAGLRDALRAKGLQRASSATWRVTAQRTLEVYRRMLHLV